jgi:hypothetical protein
MPREVDAQDLERKWNARLRTPTTSPRIAAMAANAGLSCLFWSIVHPNGLPFAEIALPAGTEAEAIPIQLGTFRIVSESEDLARAAAGFRSRAIKEFSAAPGLPVTVRLYLPWFCVLPTVDAMGVPLRGALANTGLASGRVIVELATPAKEEIPSAARRIAELRQLGVQTALRVEEVSEASSDAAFELVPDYVHVVEAPKTFDDARAMKTLFERFQSKKTRAIVGNVSGPDDAAHVDGLGVSLFYGDAVSAPRFLC